MGKISFSICSSVFYCFTCEYVCLRMTVPFEECEVSYKTQAGTAICVFTIGYDLLNRGTEEREDSTVPFDVQELR